MTLVKMTGLSKGGPMPKAEQITNISANSYPTN